MKPSVMTILKLKNLTNIYRIDLKKKLGGNEDTLLLKIYGSNQSFQGPICRFVRQGEVGERKNPRGGRKKRKKARAGRLGAGLKHHLGAIDLGFALGVRIYDAKLSVKSLSRLRRAQNPGAKIYDAETCKLGATNDDVELKVQILKSYLQGHIC